VAKADLGRSYLQKALDDMYNVLRDREEMAHKEMWLDRSASELSRDYLWDPDQWWLKDPTKKGGHMTKKKKLYEVQIFVAGQPDSAYACHTEVHNVEVNNFGVCRVWTGADLYIYCNTLEIRVLPAKEGGDDDVE
jgi:hypothetical protein